MTVNPAGGKLLSSTVAVDDEPPNRVDGVRFTRLITGAVMVTLLDAADPLEGVPVTVARTSNPTGTVLTVNGFELAPLNAMGLAAKLSGGVVSPELSVLESATEYPDGAAPVRLRDPVRELPPTTVLPSEIERPGGVTVSVAVTGVCEGKLALIVAVTVDAVGDVVTVKFALALPE